MQLAWDKRIGRFYCTLFRNREEKENPGGYLTADCRGNLLACMTTFKNKHTACSLRIGTEPEMMWLKYDERRQAEGRLFQALSATTSTSSRACVLFTCR